MLLNCSVYKTNSKDHKSFNVAPPKIAIYKIIPNRNSTNVKQKNVKIKIPVKYAIYYFD